jgi:excisionase family DNA binding protein
MKKLSTLGVAHMLDVSVKSVANWIDSGRLKAGKTPGGHRRIEPDDLVDFLRQQNLRIPAELVAARNTVLVVDDEKDVAKWIAQTISSRHPEINVLTANDGYSAGELVVSEHPSLVILDLYMPGLDGFEVCRRIKTQHRNGTTVVAITAHPSPEAQKAILDAGALVCLPKPITTDALEEVIRNILMKNK